MKDFGFNICEETKKLIGNARQIYLDNNDNNIWYGRCIFLSWYCDVGTCKFCYRSTQKSRIQHAKHARRSRESILIEALLARIYGWRMEFLTGGYRIFTDDELLEIIQQVAHVYGGKIWLNLGALKKESIDKFAPFIEGICASIETVEEKLHDYICPDKKIEPYIEMFEYLNEKYPQIKRSMTMVIGLGEKKDDFELLKDFISTYKMDRITFYALKPVKGTPYTEGPTTEDYLWWIAKTRIAFPEIEIIGGTTFRRYKEVPLIIQAGANAFTKYPLTKKFGTDETKYITDSIKNIESNLTSNVHDFIDINYKEEVDKLDLDEDLKEKMKSRLKDYLGRMKK